MMIPPIAFFTIAYISGIILGSAFHVAPAILGTLIFTVSVAYLLLPHSASLARVAVPIVLFLLLGFFLASLASFRLDSGMLRTLAGTSSYVTVEGIVSGDPSFHRGIGNFDLKISTVTVNERDWSVSERLRVKVYSVDIPSLTMGESVRVTGTLELPRSSSDFDYKSYLYHKGITAVLVASERDIKSIKGSRVSLLSLAGSVRGWIKEKNSAHLPQSCAGLLNGIVLGDTAMVGDDVDERFKLTGLTHIVAASGMNIALIVGALWPLLHILRLRAAIQLPVLIVSMALYTLISGMSPSITRAFFMATIGLIAWFIGRDKNHVISLSVAALVILVLDPFALYDIGFQLSFMATAALIFLVPVLEGFMEGLPGPVRSGLSVTLAAQIGVLPLTIYYFGFISSVSLIANMVIAPLAAPALILGMIVLPLELMSTYLSSPLYAILGVILETMISGARLLAKAPGGAIYLQKPGVVLVIALYIILIAGYISLRNLRLRLRFWSVIALLALLPAIGIWWQVERTMAPSQLEIVFLDVGQGDSAMITAPDGTRVLIDTGPSENRAPLALAKRGVNKIDAIIMSHEHADHAGGVAKLIDLFHVGTFVFPQSMGISKEGSHVISHAKTAGLKCIGIKSGDTLSIGKYLRIDTLYIGEQPEGGNDDSAVIMVSYGEVDVLFTGDAGEEAERVLVEEGGRIDAEILKVGHHGSATSSTGTFLREVSPNISVISVGKDNRYGHPTRTAIGRLRAAGSKIYRTDLHGDVTIRSDGETYKVYTEKTGE